MANLGSQPSAVTTQVEAQQARSEIQQYLDMSRQRRRIFPRAAAVGLASGLVAVLFRAALVAGDDLRNGLIAWSHQWPNWGWIFPVLLGAAGAVIAVALVRNYAPEASGSGIPHIKAVLQRFRTLSWQRVLGVKFVGGVVAISSGLALGREGPTIQMSGALADAVAGWLGASPRERLTLIAAGAGAGLAAAFNAPLSGLIFVLEEVQRDFRPVVFGAAFIAAAIADIVTRFVAGSAPVFAVPAYPAPPLTALPAFAVLGLAAGVLGVAFNRGLVAAMNAFARVPARRALLAVAVIGALVGLVGWFTPAAIGGGHTLAETVLAGNVALMAIPLWFALRFVLTIGSYGTSAPGGIFAPLLVLGALLGLAVGSITHAIAPAAAPIPAVFAVVGMAAYFTAIVRAPLTGVVLILEMTGNYEQMLPLLVSCFCAYIAAELLKDLPIYEALLERDLMRSGLHVPDSAPVVLDFVIEAGAPFAGREVRNLGLPPGCVLVRCADGGREWVPTAQTRLEPHMRITAVVAPEAKNGLELLREGCRAHE